MTVTMTVNAIAIATTIMMMTCATIPAIAKEGRLAVVEITITATTMIPEAATIAVAQAPPRHMTRLMTIITMTADTVQDREGRTTQ